MCVCIALFYEIIFTNPCVLCALRTHSCTMQFHVVMEVMYSHSAQLLAGFCGSPFLSGPHGSVSGDGQWSYT